jgi:hypothetical protein
VRPGFRPGWQQSACIAVVAMVAVVLLPIALGGCGSIATDPNEPNDELNTATVLAPGTPAQGVIGRDDSDVFRCDAPAGDVMRSFLVAVRSDTPQDLDLQVGASIPGAWEGITWPGWEVDTSRDRLEVAGTLRKGTVLMFPKGTTGATY